MAGTAPFDSNPLKSAKFFKDRPENLISLAEDIGIGHICPEDSREAGVLEIG
jgi:hypothetical protein